MSSVTVWAPIISGVADDSVFKALADPSRRLLLDRLFERDGRTLGQLEAEIPTMTRFGVMKHLRILEAAGLVVTRRSGRHKLHYLNGVPVQQIYDRWVSKFTASRAAALADLKAALEGGQDMASRPQQVYRVFIKSSPEAVWEAITNADFTARYFYGSRIESTLVDGSSFTYHNADHSDVLVNGVVLESHPPNRLVHTWRMLYRPDLAADPPSRLTWEIEAQPGGICSLTVTHDEFESETPTFREVAGGWSFVLSGLKTLLETGVPLKSD
jgi:uncharacterized protein YndB with AHSA1/START domain/DNA-binding transcriptional ArsR family regulator